MYQWSTSTWKDAQHLLELSGQGKSTMRYPFLLNRMEVNNNSNSSGKQGMWNEVLIGNTTWLNLKNIILGIRRQKNSHVCCIISCTLNVPNHQIHRKQIFLAPLGLHCCVWAFSSRGKQGLLSSCGAQASHCSAFPCCRAVSRRVAFSSCGAPA